MLLEGAHVMATGVLLASGGGSGEGSPAGILLAGPIAALAVYGLLFRYYRNTDKSHSYETETRIEAAPIGGAEQKVNEVRGTRSGRIGGDNVSDFRRRVQRLP